MKNKLQKLLKSDWFDSVKVGSKYLVLIFIGFTILGVLINALPYIFYSILFIGILTLFSYMIGELVKMHRKYK